MAKTKAELLEEAKALKLEVTVKNTVTEITAALKSAEKLVDGKTEPKTTKAGKHSAKAIRETEAEQERQARKETGSDIDGEETHVKKGPKPVTRPMIERRGKKYQKAAEAIDKAKVYSLGEAMELAAKSSPVKFDASVEIHVNLGVDPRQADQNIRATVSLPHGTGKNIRVAVFAPSEAHASAKKAGADIIGEDEFLAQLDKEVLDFDVLISTPQLMPKLGKYARLLGPRGLMPNPKSGTVATNVTKAVEEAKAGRVEYRVDKQSIIHLAIGKVSFGGKKLNDNAKSFFESLSSVKPSSLKTAYIKNVSVTTTMGPGIKVDTSSL